MVLLLADLVLPVLQAAAYAALGLCVQIHATLRALAALSACSAARLAAAAPALRPLLVVLFALPPREHVGSRPLPPTVLGVAVAEQVQEDQWPAAVEALGRLLAWCVCRQASPCPLPFRAQAAIDSGRACRCDSGAGMMQLSAGQSRSWRR